MAAFTLIELLTVVAVMAILGSILVPALPGLLGVGGRQGGVSTLGAALEQARLSAMESGATTYVGFPFAAADTNAAYSSVLVFREATNEEKAAESGTLYKPVTKWLRLPSGVFLSGTNLTPSDLGSGAKSLAVSGLPKLGGETISSLTVIPFDRFGKLARGSSPVGLRVGEKAAPDAGFLRDANNYVEFEIQPLTGRVRVSDKSGQP